MAEQPEKTVKRVVTHPKLFMKVEGKLQHVPQGTELTLTDSQADALADKTADPAELKKLDSTSGEGRIIEGSEAETKALQDMATQLHQANEGLATAQQENEALKNANGELQQQFTEANAKIAELSQQ